MYSFVAAETPYKKVLWRSASRLQQLALVVKAGAVDFWFRASTLDPVQRTTHL